MAVLLVLLQGGKAVYLYIRPQPGYTVSSWNDSMKQLQCFAFEAQVSEYFEIGFQGAKC